MGCFGSFDEHDIGVPVIIEYPEASVEESVESLDYHGVMIPFGTQIVVDFQGFEGSFGLSFEVGIWVRDYHLHKSVAQHDSVD
jgi:hypothetical protein